MARTWVFVNILLALTMLLCCFLTANHHLGGAGRSSSSTSSSRRVPLAAPPPPTTAAVIYAGNTWTAPPLPSVDAARVPGQRLPLLPSLLLATAAEEDWTLPPVELRGQVTLETTFGRELNRLARLPHVHLVLEIGTWYGGGSSWCIAQGLRSSLVDASRPDKWLFTMELFEDAWRYASMTLRRLPATCLRAGTVGLEGYLRPEQLTAEDRANEHYRLYYARDVALAEAVKPLLAPLCAAYDFDLVLIDGNEYTGLAEYELVDRACRPRYLALHDTGTLKTREVERRLAAPDSGWQKLSGGVDGAGWAVYERSPQS